jgi:hypothetical protein
MVLFFFSFSVFIFSFSPFGVFKLRKKNKKKKKFNKKANNEQKKSIKQNQSLLLFFNVFIFKLVFVRLFVIFYDGGGTSFREM